MVHNNKVTLAQFREQVSVGLCAADELKPTIEAAGASFQYLLRQGKK